jgi:hypothetical protein
VLAAPLRVVPFARRAAATAPTAVAA